MSATLALLALASSLSCASAPAARFATAPCAFTVPAGASVRCGWLTAPEDRTKRGGRNIRLHVAIYKSASSRPAPDPIVWLVGGPGGRAHAISSNLFQRVIAPCLGRRDFIMLDVRGTGCSQPALDCPDRAGPPARWLAACRERLAATADLACYNSAAVAANLADLRAALGINQWNLLGESYGTRLALVALRDRPEGIRSVVLDSVAPPEADEYADAPAKFENALEALFRNCAADRGCKAAFPDLRAKLLAAARARDARPRRLEGDWFGAHYDVRFDGGAMLQALHAALYEADLIPRLPKAIAGGDEPLWRQALGIQAVIRNRLTDVGAYYSYHCYEENPFADTARMLAENEKRPWMRRAVSASGIRDACRMWLPGVAGESREALPVKSGVPVLLLAGEYDPVTPPAYAASAAAHLRNGYLFVFPGLGHWVTANTVSTCPQELVLEFLDNPGRRPTGACAAAYKPKWQL